MDLTKEVYFITSTVVDLVDVFTYIVHFRLFGFIGFGRCMCIINADTQDIRIAKRMGGAD